MRDISDFEAVLSNNFSLLWSRHQGMVYHWAWGATKVTGLELDDLVAEGMALFHERMKAVDPSRIKDPETFNFSRMIYNPLKKITRKHRSVKLNTLRAMEVSLYVESPRTTCSVEPLLGLHHADLFKHSPATHALDELDRLAWENLKSSFTLDQQRLVDMRAQGYTIRQISFELNLSRTSILNHLKALEALVCREFGLTSHPVRGFAVRGA